MLSHQDRKQQVRHAVTCFAVLIFAFAFYYFFSEGLPWFWYDDVWVLEFAERASGMNLFQNFFSFTLPPTAEGRVILFVYTKIGMFLFGDSPHYFRQLKILILLTVLVLIYIKIIRQGGDDLIAGFTLPALVTLPSLVISNIWVCEASAFLLFFMLLAFYIFFAMLDIEGGSSKSSPGASDSSANASPSGEGSGGTTRRLVFLGALLLLIIMSADKSKATGKIIPCIFLAYLVLTRNRNYVLYAVSILGLLAVIPYHMLTPGLSRIVGRTTTFQLFLSYLAQSWPFLASAFIVWAISPQKEFLKRRPVIFFSLWLLMELLFMALYPTGELRYLFTTLSATAIWFMVIVSQLLSDMRSVRLRMSVRSLLVVMTIFMLAYNTYWTYNFRAYFGGEMVLADKKMKYAEQNFSNSLFLYSDYPIKYFGRNTSNVYANMNPKNAFSYVYDQFVELRDRQVRIVSPEKYQNIILLDNSLRLPDSSIEATFDSVIRGSFFDRIQSRFRLPVGKVSFYNNKVVRDNSENTYPIYSSIYRMK